MTKDSSIIHLSPCKKSKGEEEIAKQFRALFLQKTKMQYTASGWQLVTINNLFPEKLASSDIHGHQTNTYTMCKTHKHKLIYKLI